MSVLLLVMMIASLIMSVISFRLSEKRRAVEAREKKELLEHSLNITGHEINCQYCDQRTIGR